MQEEIVHIITKYLEGEVLSDEQAQILEQWRNNSSHNEEVLAQLKDSHFLKRSIQRRELYEAAKEANYRLLLGKIRNEETAAVTTPKLRTIKSWLRYAAAAMIMLAVGAYLWNLQTAKRKPATAATSQTKILRNDIRPGNNKPVLTLADGTSVVLDSSAQGLLSQQGNVRINRSQEGNIEYTPSASTAVLLYNTVSVPRGSDIAQLKLSDGTRVWLNAASSLRYPVSFIGSDRSVEITGEAYFEVAKNKSKPFRVRVGKQTVEVLGTAFNVNAYAEEAVVKTSLAEGSIKIAETVLKPGQAFIAGKIVPTNIEQDIAWKNGYFSFQQASLEQVLRQLSRWYDVDIVYEGNIPVRNFEGEIGRDLTLIQVLRILEKNNVHFELNGKKLVVRP